MMNNLYHYDNQVIKEVMHLIDSQNLFPKVYISYKRLALVGKHDSEFRLTFDFEIKARRNNLALNDTHDSKSVLDSSLYVMEIKINQAMELWLSKLLSELQIYPTSFSKYGYEYKKNMKERNLTWNG